MLHLHLQRNIQKPYKDLVYFILLSLRKRGKKVKQTPWPQVNEWFSQKFAGWFIEQQHTPKGLWGIFTRMVKALKGIASRFTGTGRLSPSMEALFNDIVTNGREVRKKGEYHYSREEDANNYVLGRPPTADELSSQGIHGNQKTGFSVDFSTSCPKQIAFVDYLVKQVDNGVIEKNDLLDPMVLETLYEQALSDGVDVPCRYCYVEEGRRKAIAWFAQGKPKSGVVFSQAKQVYREILEYRDRLIAKNKNGEYVVPDKSSKKDKDRKELTVENINARGGLRLFSFSDYIRSRDFDQIKRLLLHAAMRGIGVKAITKQEDFITDWADTGININISMDQHKGGGPGAGMAWEKAIRYKEQYSNVHLRTVGRNMDEIDRYFRMMYRIGKGGKVEILDPWHVDPKNDKLPSKKNKSYEKRLSEGGWKRVFEVIA